MAEQLQSAFFVERLKYVYGKMAKAEGNMEAVCEMCTGGEGGRTLPSLRGIHVQSLHSLSPDHDNVLYNQSVYS